MGIPLSRGKTISFKSLKRGQAKAGDDASDSKSDITTSSQKTMTTTPNESEPEFDRYNLVEKLEEDVKDIEGLNDPHKEGLLGSLSRLPTEAKENVLSALRGNTSARLHDKARIVRIFTSSTFTDTIVERNIIMQNVYPKLKKHCQERGYEFQVVDMRWGVRDEATDDHQAIELCLREIENCQKISTGPSFVSLLGQKYGYRPIPSKIPADEFESLCEHVAEDDGIDLLKSWYSLDENHVPPVYMLQPISSRIPDYVNARDEAVRENGINEWNKVLKMLKGILRARAEKLSEEKRRKYFISVTEAEVDKGLLSMQDKDHGCLWFHRIIYDLREHIDNPHVNKFMNPSDDLNKEAPFLLERLKSNMRERMHASNRKEYKIMWHENGVDPEHMEHSEYLDQFSNDFYQMLATRIDGAIQKKSETEVHLTVYEEVSQHITFAKSKCEFFHGRQEQLDKIKNYIKGSDCRPLVVHGTSGSGKTSVISMAVVSCRHWLDSKASVVVRFLGTTPDSSLLRRLIITLCEQLAILMEIEYEVTTRKDLKTLKEDFVNFLNLAGSYFQFNKESPLCIFLDSLDQLSPEDGALQLSWLPTTLPSNVKIVLSTIPNQEYYCYPTLRALLPDSCFVEVPRLPKSDADCILDKWISANHRTLTQGQRTILLDAFEKCSLPIFLKVSFDEALTWRSYTPKNETVLQSTVRGAINALFERTERLHGRVLVQHALAYITAAKNGLTETELEDILSCDDDVLEDVYQYWIPPIRRIPPLLWVRIRSDLASYLVDRGADDSRVVTWYHRQFTEAAQERYLSDERERTRTYSDLASYFLDLWSDGSRKPFKDKDGVIHWEDRLITSIPMTFRSATGTTTFNLRKLNELPYHLIKAEDIELLKRECLCNYEFLLAHLRALGLRDVLDNFELALSVAPNDGDLIIVNETLKLSTNALSLWPGQLASQLLSRIPKENVEVSEYLTTLDEQARKPPMPAFVPQICCLTSPGGPLQQSLSGCSHPALALRLSEDGTRLVSVSDDEILIWDVRGGRLIRNIECPGEGKTFVCQSEDTVIISRAGMLKSWHMSTGQPIISMEDHQEIAPIALCEHKSKSALATFISGKLFIIDIKTGKIPREYHDNYIRSTDGKTDFTYLAAWKSKILLAHKAMKHSSVILTMEVVDLGVKNHKNVWRIKTSTNIQSVEILQDHQVLIAYSGSTDNHIEMKRPSVASNWTQMNLELWSFRTMKPAGKLTDDEDQVRCSCVNANRDKVIIFCNSTFVELACEFRAVVKIYSVFEKAWESFRLHYPSTITVIGGLGANCLVTSSLDKIIRVWDLCSSSDPVLETSSAVVSQNEAGTDNPMINDTDEDFHLAACSEHKLLVYYRSGTETNMSVLIWDLETDSKVKISGFYNPEACFSGESSDYIAVVCSSKLSVYSSISGEFINSVVVDICDTGSDRLVGLTNGNILVVDQERHKATVYSVENLDVINTAEVKQTECIIRVITSSNRELFAVCICEPEKDTLKCTCEIWESSTTSISSVVYFGRFSSEFSDTQISDDGKVLADVAFDRDVGIYRTVIWDTQTGEILFSTPRQPYVHVFTLSRDGQFFVTASWQGSIHLYDLKTFSTRWTSMAHIGAVHKILLSENGSMALTIAGGFNSRDRSIRLWNTDDGEMITEFTPDVKISSLIMTYDSKYVVLEIQGKLAKFEMLHGTVGS